MAVHNALFPNSCHSVISAIQMLAFSNGRQWLLTYLMMEVFTIDIFSYFGMHGFMLFRNLWNVTQYNIPNFVDTCIQTIMNLDYGLVESIQYTSIHLQL